MRHLLAIFFLTIFSFQVLPVKEIGKLLFKSQTTEEVHEGSCDNLPDAKAKKEGDPFHPVFFDNISRARVQNLTARIALVIHRTSELPDYHIPDIVTPPPNAC